MSAMINRRTVGSLIPKLFSSCNPDVFVGIFVIQSLCRISAIFIC